MCLFLILNISVLSVAILFQTSLLLICDVHGIFIILLQNIYVASSSFPHPWRDCPSFTAISKDGYHITVQHTFLCYHRNCSISQHLPYLLKYLFRQSNMCLDLDNTFSIICSKTSQIFKILHLLGVYIYNLEPASWSFSHADDYALHLLALDCQTFFLISSTTLYRRQ